MAAKKNLVLEDEEIEIEEEENRYDNVSLDDGITVRIEEKQPEYKGEMVRVFLPKLEEEGSGIKVDQFEHVTISNEAREWTWRVQRGVWVDVPIPVFVQLKNKFPDI